MGLEAHPELPLADHLRPRSPLQVSFTLAVATTTLGILATTLTLSTRLAIFFSIGPTGFGGTRFVLAPPRSTPDFQV